MVGKRGEIWWANLRGPIGSEPGYRRPFLIVQDDSYNNTVLRTIIGIVFTGNLGLAGLPGNVFVSADESGLPKDSVANVTQLTTTDRMFLSECVGQLTPETMERIEKGLLLVLSLKR